MKALRKNQFFSLCIVILTSGFFYNCATTSTDTLYAESATFETQTDIPETTAIAFVKNLGHGINIGNTLDCIVNQNNMGVIDSETAWGNPQITKEYVHALKEYGYTTIRLPVTWAEHTNLKNGEYTIDAKWMARVKECVEYCLNEGFYVIINLHHDGGYSRTSWILNAWNGKFEETKVRFVRMWEQIAQEFKDYDEHLIFEAMNEVGSDTSNGQDSYDVLNRLNQTFVNTVRASGGNNKDRFLMISGYWTDIQASCNNMFKMPRDSEENTEDPRLILSVHYYTPSSFAISEDSSNRSWYRSSWGDENDVRELRTLFDLLHETFLLEGVPVIIGEYGCVRSKNAKYRTAWFSCVRRISISYGICPILWDTGIDISRRSPFAMSEALSKANSQ